MSAASGSDQSRTRRIEIDWTRCDGHGLCRALVPELTADEWGFPVLPASTVDEQQARRAVAACPSLALRLTT